MAGEILSPDEVERILSMMSGTKPIHAEPPQPRKPDPPPRLPLTKLRQLQSKLEHAGTKIAAHWSRRLMCCLEIKLTTIDTLLYSEFVFGLDNPSCFCQIAFHEDDTTRQAAVLDFNPTCAFGLFERMLGGGREQSLSIRRRMTKIEQACFTDLLQDFLHIFGDAWGGKFIELVKMESNHHLISCFPHGKEVVAICFEVCMTDRRGGLCLAIPIEYVEQFLGPENAESDIE